MLITTVLFMVVGGLAIALSLVSNRSAGNRNRAKTPPVDPKPLWMFLAAQIGLGVLALVVIATVGGTAGGIATAIIVVGTVVLVVLASRLPRRKVGPMHQGRVTR